MALTNLNYLKKKNDRKPIEINSIVIFANVWLLSFWRHLISFQMDW